MARKGLLLKAQFQLRQIQFFNDSPHHSKKNATPIYRIQIKTSDEQRVLIAGEHYLNEEQYPIDQSHQPTTRMTA
ncbi:hypothetical protein OIU84_008364 [Salix udensis]|uniref:Uncharacterized protein n=1 Tax=Salix udensis TaxID=889485 RepID=A0AAD6JVN6_9ROSI|nr:hypothetical protein OIU84_008364 [Salix udensis]